MAASCIQHRFTPNIYTSNRTISPPQHVKSVATHTLSGKRIDLCLYTQDLHQWVWWAHKCSCVIGFSLFRRASFRLRPVSCWWQGKKLFCNMLLRHWVMLVHTVFLRKRLRLKQNPSSKKKLRHTSWVTTLFTNLSLINLKLSTMLSLYLYLPRKTAAKLTANTRSPAGQYPQFISCPICLLNQAGGAHWLV